MNPFKDNPFKNLSKPQKYAVIGGGALVGGVLVYRHHSQTGSWNPFAKTSSAAGSGTTIDPVTGMAYSQDNVVDPATGQTYLAEAEQYGSVQAAEASVSAFGASSSTGSGIPVSPASPGQDNGTPAPTGQFATNEDWTQAVIAGLTQIGYTETAVDGAIQAYLSSSPETPDQVKIMRIALSEFNPPPVGSFTIIPAPPTGPGKTMIEIPHIIIGMDVEQATAVLEGAGLRANGPKGVVGAVHRVTSTSPAVGTKVTQGTTVTLHYKTVKESQDAKA